MVLFYNQTRETGMVKNRVLFFDNECDGGGLIGNDRYAAGDSLF
jgi:hypothetical protein